MTMDNGFQFAVEDTLEDALAKLVVGIPMEEVLAEAGKDAEWLRLMLEMVDEVGQLQQSVSIPGPGASLQMMLSHAEQMAGRLPAEAPTQPGLSEFFSNFFRGGFRLATGLATALLVIFLVGGMLNLAAQRSLPGQTLYWLKQTSESLQLSLTRNPDQRDRLLDTFNQRRRMEIEQLLDQSQKAQVTLQGQIQTITPNSIELEGLFAQLTPDTRIKGHLVSGATVRVELTTQPPDQLIALSITVIQIPLATSSPTSTATPSATPTATPAKVQATDTLPTLEPTETPFRSQEVDTLPTIAPSLTPTVIPTEDTEFEEDVATDEKTNDLDDSDINDDDSNLNDDFDEDDFDDEIELPEDAGDNGNDNSSGNDDNKDDSGSNDNGDDDDKDDSGSNDNGDDDDKDNSGSNNDDDDSSNDD